MENVPDETARLIDAIRKTRGWLGLATYRLGISRGEIERCAKESKQLAEAIHQEKKLNDDVAESKLFAAVQEGEPWAVTLYLKLRQATRGDDEAAGPIHTNVREEWYDNDAHDRDAPSAAASAADTAQPGAVQAGGVRETVGEDRGRTDGGG